MYYVVAVLDIGKTHKKIALYDDAMHPVTVRKCTIETIRFNSLDVENIEAIFQWYLQQLTDLSSQYNIRAISVTTHGASLVCLDAEGHPSVPPVAYTNEVEEGVHQRFWHVMGDPKEIQRTTATTEIKPLINPAKLLWFLKEKWPEDFRKTASILFFPQYFGYRLTGKIAADITYTGCHGYLWDFNSHDWSKVADKLGIRKMLPKTPQLPTTELGRISGEVAALTGLEADTLVTLGIHDSNSSLIPYLITQNCDFVLNSTGTWCVAMHPVDTVHFEDNELGKMVFYNLSYLGKPVKTSILMGGLEYAVYTDLLMKHHGQNNWPDYDAKMYRDILAKPRSFLLPSIIPGSGQFPDSVAKVIDDGTEYSVKDITSGRAWPRIFEDYRSGFALANLSLAIQTCVALNRVGLAPGTAVFIEGGFRKNTNYGALLGALLPENPLFLTALQEATSFGAALTAKALVDGVAVGELKHFVKLDKRPVKAAQLEGLSHYMEIFLSHIE